MRKILALIVAMSTIVSASAVSYKGYADDYVGVAAPSGEDAGLLYGFSTSHGVQIIDGLFVGGGMDLASYVYFYPKYYVGYGVSAATLFAVFAEGRYNFLRTKRVSPFVGFRVGGGFNGYDKEFAVYTSPAVGCTINITKRFGLDVSLAYGAFTGEGHQGFEENKYGINMRNIHSVSLRLGVHF